MATAEGSRRTAAGESGRESARGRGRGAGGPRGLGTREEELDLLTAALLGAAIGAAAGYLLRPRRRPRTALAALEMVPGRTGKTARRVTQMRKGAAGGAEWVRERGSELADVLSPDEVRAQLRHYLGDARERISDAVEEELRDLRRAIRRRRRKLGV